MHSTRIMLSMLLALAEVGLAVPTAVQDASTVHTIAVDIQQLPSNQSPSMSTANRFFDPSNRCGKIDGKDVMCDPKSPGGGSCCSSYGFCGNDSRYCGEGCQPGFGTCGGLQATAENINHHRQKHCGPKHKNKKCGHGECCSRNGKCGHGPAFCGKHCQPAFGTCDTEHKPSPSHKPKPIRCGKNHGGVKCVDGECCSRRGWCGRGNDFCKVPLECQRGFGNCDSDTTPRGPDISTQRGLKPASKVPFGKQITTCTKSGTAALTFDDGPSNNTEKILDLLKAHNATATFFLSGNTMGKGMIDRHDVWINAVKRIITEGHQIGSHTWSHPNLNKLSRNARLTEMFRNERAIANIVGKIPTYMRPPYMECNKLSGCLDDMSDLGYHIISQDVDSHDWEEATTLEQMKIHIDTELKDRTELGHMILIQHDHNKYAVDLAEYALNQIKKKNWKAVTVGECLNDPAELWYHGSVWVDPKSMAKDGCVVTGRDFCGPLFPFHNHKTCKSAYKQCKRQANECLNNKRTDHKVCKSYEKVCNAQDHFCKTCHKKKKGDCNSNAWSFNRH